MAGISISSLTGSGLFEKAKKAEEENKRASIIEYINLKINEVVIDNYDKDDHRIIEIANEEFKKEETKNGLKQYGKEVTVSDIIEQGDKTIFYVTVDNKIYEVQRTGATYKGESIEVGKPSIEVISGTQGDNGYYRSNVKVKIAQINTENSSKIEYRLEGAMTAEKKEIENGGIIEITEEGTTNIIATSYDYTNKKSEEAKLEIKKDSIAPKIELADANPDEREYTKTIKANITDDTSNIVSKKWEYGPCEISDNFYNEFENDFIVGNVRSRLSDMWDDEENTEDIREFVQTYTVYAKDEAGNEAIKIIRLPNLLVTWVVAWDITMDGMLGYNEYGEPIYSAYEISLKKLPKGVYKLIYEGNNLPVLDYDGDNILNIDTEYLNNPSKKVYTFEMINPNEGYSGTKIGFTNKTEAEAYIENMIFQEL